ncbi:MAG: DNA polymerase III subunit delta [Firmicutes bacterium HGW-Firmicutes-15]|nr:MAG: DNA polymerase III subunit delta [Firmicutes bacterium HGW-Firmicutes-15]
MADHNAYYIWGEESYLIDQEIQKIIAGVAKDNGDEPEVVLVDADELSSMELGQTLEFSPLFAMSRVVILKKPAWLGKSSRKVRKTEESLQVLQDYFGHDNHGQVLILTSAEYNTSNPVTKFLNQQVRVMNIKAPLPTELEEWCKAEFSRRNIRVVPAALKRIVNSGQDMYYLENLIEKLSLIVKPDVVVGVNEIEEQLDSKQAIKVFKLTDALLNRNLKASLAAFYQLQEQGEHHLLILHMITRQILSLSKVKLYQEMGYSSGKIAEVTSQKDFVVKKIMEKSSRFSREEIRALFERLLEMDTSFKSEAKDPRILMETLLVEICSQK